MVIIIINFIQVALRLCFNFVQSVMTFLSFFFFPWNKACLLMGQNQAYLSFWRMKSLGVRKFPQNAMPVPFRIHVSPHTLSCFPNSLTVPHLNVYKPWWREILWEYIVLFLRTLYYKMITFGSFWSGVQYPTYSQ